MMDRIPALTSIRFVAALVVFLHHYIVLRGWRHWGDGWSAIGEHFSSRLIFEMRYGVTLFFVLSGFLLAARYFDSIFKRVSFKDYWIKRFARIFPLYWVLCGILLVFYFLKDKDLTYFPVYFSLTQGFFSDLKFRGMETAWSLTVEESFYLTLPILLISFRWMWGRQMQAWLRYVLMSAILLGFMIVFYQIGRFFLNQDAFHPAGFFERKDDMRLYTIFGRFFDFAIGVFFGVLYVKSRFRLLQRGWLADVLIAVSIAGIVVTCNAIAMNKGLESDTGFRLNSLNAVFSAIIIYFLCVRRSWFAMALSWRPFVYLGELSFALYLVHKNGMVNWMYIWLAEHNVPLLPSVIGLYVIFTLIAVACYEVIERPLQHIILAKWTGRVHMRRPTVLRFLTGRRYEEPVAA